MGEEKVQITPARWDLDKNLIFLVQQWPSQVFFIGKNA
jgi:hypothetical protein